MLKTNAGKFAASELDILLSTVKEPAVKPFVKEIIALAERFGKSGQSGGSAPFTASALADTIKKLCLFEPICPITGIEAEWFAVSSYCDNDGNIYQNKRCSAVFKEGKEGRPYYLDAVVFKTDKDVTWSGSAFLNGVKIESRQYIKKFPFTPKTFYVDVTKKEVEKDSWEFYIKDENQLKAAFKYYDRFDQ